MVDKQRLQDAKKKKDGWWASVFCGPVANVFLIFIADKKWITPNCVTTSSLFLCFIACAFISLGAQPSLTAGAVLIQLVFILDCLDGQLARYRDAGTNFGAWYDRITDRVKDFLIYFSIAWGHYKVYMDWKIWPLAMTSLFFVYLFDYYVNQDIKLEPRRDAVNRVSTTGILHKLFSIGENIYKSIPILQFHIGEQYLLISLFLFFNQTRLLFFLIIFLGVFYAFYWPFSKYYGRKPS